ncbi:MAG: nitrogenase [Mogibacterium sp.]|nr:nitrogenase [Mogibacterium sp.]
MLKKVNEKQNIRLSADEIPHVRIADANFPAPFRSGLEYSSPARGTWNIVHTGMLIPEAHEIFVCAAGCLRGVVLTAAEMGTTDRFSTVAVRENNLLDGDMEDLVIEGVTDIINKLPKRPPAVLVYTSCVHHFTGVDLDMIYATLRSRFPDIDFTDCYMNPIMRKSGLTPDQLMRSRLYMLLHEREIDPQAVAIIGNDLPTDEDSDLMKILKGAGLKIHEITSCKNYEEYQQMAESRVYVSYNPDAAPGGDMLSERLGGTHYALKFSFDYDEIDETFAGLAEVLGTAPRSSEEISALRAECEKELEETKKLIGETPVSIDYTYCPRPLGLAKLLLDHGFNVTKVYADGIPGGDKAAFESLQKEHPDLMIYPTVHPGMRFARTANVEEQGEVKVLAIGQKAAAFEETDHFINVVEGGGMNGYEAVMRTCRLMREAFLEKKEMRELVQVKGLGCEVCIR